MLFSFRFSSLLMLLGYLLLRPAAPKTKTFAIVKREAWKTDNYYPSLTFQNIKDCLIESFLAGTSSMFIFEKRCYTIPKRTDWKEQPKSNRLNKLKTFLETGVQPCRTNWQTSLDTSFYYLLSSSSWPEAQKSCREYGKLVQISTADELSFLSESFSKPFWTGLSRSSEDIWVWDRSAEIVPNLTSIFSFSRDEHTKKKEEEKSNRDGKPKLAAVFQEGGLKERKTDEKHQAVCECQRL